MVIDLPLVARAIEQSQIKMEGYNFDVRKHLLEYDDVINKQRQVIYGERQKILEATSLKSFVQNMIHEELGALVEQMCPGNYKEEWTSKRWRMKRGAFSPCPKMRPNSGRT